MEPEAQIDQGEVEPKLDPVDRVAATLRRVFQEQTDTGMSIFTDFRIRPLWLNGYKALFLMSQPPHLRHREYLVTARHSTNGKRVWAEVKVRHERWLRMEDGQVRDHLIAVATDRWSGLVAKGKSNG